MKYTEALDYMFNQLPMFQRLGSAAYKANLDNTYAICDLLQNPQKSIPCIHIAGTNGKGSTSHMMASILQEAGYKTGLYTSPHLKDYRERIKINGKPISKAFVTQFIEKHKSDFDHIKPSFFEMTVGLAFQYFYDKKVDIAVIETGLGGRLDSTNVISPLLSVITNISLDHTNLLGTTLQAIAIEKAGIIKKNTPIVIGETQTETQAIFEQKALALSAPIVYADQVYVVNWLPKKRGVSVVKNTHPYYKSIANPLKGNYQLKNIATLLAAVDEMVKKGFAISTLNIKKGIEKVVSNTGLLGRWQILSTQPLCIADTGHNEAGIKIILAQLKETPFEKLHFVLGMVNDKDVSTILSMLPKDAVYYFCKANIPRGLEVQELSQLAQRYGLQGNSYSSVKKAFNAAQLKALKNDLVFVGGSTFVVAEVV